MKDRRHSIRTEGVTSPSQGKTWHTSLKCRSLTVHRRSCSLLGQKLSLKMESIVMPADVNENHPL